jgi:hypothetical protein
MHTSRTVGEPRGRRMMDVCVLEYMRKQQISEISPVNAHALTGAAYDAVLRAGSCRRRERLGAVGGRMSWLRDGGSSK